MQRGWGEWSPFEQEVPLLPNAWEAVTAEQQVADRPYDYLPDLDLVLELAIQYGGPILDLACGTGRVALALAQRGYTVVGLDINPDFLRRAREEAERLGPEVVARVRFETGDVRNFRLPERFRLVVMMDQAFKYLLRHDDQLDCLACVREHLSEDGRFLVEHRCLFKLPDAGTDETYSFTWGGHEWDCVDTYDPIQQVGVIARQPADDPQAPPELEPCRDFTYQELALLHKVTGWELDEVVSDLDEREPTALYFDAALVLRKTEPWQTRT